MLWEEENQVYEGEWKNDIIEGFGVYTYISNFSIKK